MSENKPDGRTYSWIHSMKNAALEAHAKGQSMLKAQHDRKVEAKRLMTEGAADMQGGSRKAFQPSTTPESGVPTKTPLEPTTQFSLERAGGDFSEYQAVKAAKFAKVPEPVRGKFNNGPTKKDLNKDGAVDASDVASDAADGTMDDEDGGDETGYSKSFRNNIDVSTFGSRLPSYPWAHAEEAAEELGHAEATHNAEQEDKQNNVDSMIDRIMRGKK